MASYSKIARMTLLAGSVLSICVEHAWAGAFGLNEYDAIGTGMAGAGLGTGGLGLGSVEFNPAAVTNFDGTRSSSTFNYIRPEIRIDAPTGSTGDIAQRGRLVPASQTSYQIDDHWWVGITFSSPFGLLTSINADNWASYHGRVSKILDVDATPFVAYKVNDWLSVGAGLQINYIEAEFGSSLTPFVPGSALRMSGSDTSLGYKLGVTLRPAGGTEIGIGYRSQLDPNLHGDLWTNTPIPGASGLLLPGTQDMNVGLKLPAQLNVGVRQVITPDLTILASYQWTNWSVFDHFMTNTNAGPAIPLNFGMKDGWLVALGGEYKLNNTSTVRAGIGYEKSPITTAVREPRLPDADRVAIAVGYTYKYSDKLSFDAGYTHTFVKDGPIDLTSPGVVPLTGTAKAQVNIAAVTVNYKW